MHDDAADSDAGADDDAAGADADAADAHVAAVTAASAPAEGGTDGASDGRRKRAARRDVAAARDDELDAVVREFDLDAYDDDADADDGPGDGDDAADREARSAAALLDSIAGLGSIAIDQQSGQHGAADRADEGGADEDGDDDADDLGDVMVGPLDNLIVVGQSEEDYSHLEVYLYEESAANLYVRHEVLLSAMPLCLEWLDFPAGSTDTAHTSNLVAVGTMEPDIELWDLDVVDPLEPVCCLARAATAPASTNSLSLGTGAGASRGDRTSRRRSRDREARHAGRSRTAAVTADAAGGTRMPAQAGHRDAVLSLTWNTTNRHLLVSGSADCTAKLWDLRTASCVYTYEHHTDKVQTVQWSPSEPSVLLTGSYDRSVALLDSREPTAIARWQLPSDIECASWNPAAPFYFAVRVVRRCG